MNALIRPASFRSLAARASAFWSGLAMLVAVVSVPLAGAEHSDAPPTERPMMSDTVAAELGKVQALLDEKKFDEAFASLRALLAHGKKDSYDEVVVNSLLAQTYLLRGGKEDFAAAIPHLEVGANSRFYDQNRRADFLFLLAQLYLQTGDAKRAEQYADRFLAMVEKPKTDQIIFHASLVMMRAQDENPVNKDLSRQVLAEVDRALHTVIKPPENLLLLKAVALQALERFDDAAEVLELMVKLNPSNKQCWPQLFSLYANAQRDLRALITLKRAQELGLMNSPRERMVLVSLYYNMENYARAIALLEAGLHDGTIESVPQNWELLAFAYQRTHRPMQAIKTYEEAAALFPGGKFDAQVSNLYYSQNDLPRAFEAARRALQKGALDRPEQLATFAAFLGYELKRYRESLDILVEAERWIKSDRDRGEYLRLRKAVEDALATATPSPAAGKT